MIGRGKPMYGSGSNRRLTEPPIKCPFCLRRDVPPRMAALHLAEHVEADRAPGGDFVILEIVSEWHATSSSPAGDFPMGKYVRHRCPKCKYDEILGPS